MAKKEHRLRCIHVTAGKNIHVPDGFSISHSVLIEPKRGKPYFTVLLSDEKKENREQQTSAIGFKVYK